MMKFRRVFSILLIIFAGACFLSADDFVENLNDDSFDKAVKNKVYIVDFYANWCAPCRDFSPTFSVVAEKLKKYNFAKVNVDSSQEVVKTYDVTYIPYIVAIKDGKVVAQYSGSRTIEDFLQWCRKIFDEYK